MNDGLMDSEDAKAQYERLQRGTDLQRLSIRTDEDGNSTFLGFKIAKSLRPVLETALPNVIYWLQDTGSRFSYDKALKTATWLQIGDAKAKNVALAAEMGIRFGMIGLKPITDAIISSKSYAARRKALFEEFAPIMEATKTNYKTNEVIGHAFDMLHEDVVVDMKRMGADILTIAPLIHIGIGEQRAAMDARKSKQAVLRNVSSAPDDAARADALEAAQELAYEEKLRKQMLGDKQEFTTAQERMFHQKLEERHQKKMRALREGVATPHDKDPGKFEKLGSNGVILGLSLASQVIKTNVEENASKRNNATSAWEKIRSIKHSVESQCGRSGRRAGDRDCGEFSARNPDEIYIEKIDGRGTMSLKEAIFDAFNQNEIDHGRMAIGEALKPQLQPAIDQIAEVIADGRLDPLALVNFVGGNKVIEHRGQSRTFASADKMEKLVDEQLAILSTRERVKPEEFFANFADPALIQKTLKNNLATMQGKEKAFFASLFPDDILIQAGMKKKDIAPLRKQVHDQLYHLVSSAVLQLATQSPEDLAKQGLNEEQIHLVQGMAERINERDFKAIQQMVDGRDKAAFAVLRTVGLNRQVAGEGANTWTNMVKDSAGKAKNLVAEAKAENVEASAVQREEVRRRKSGDEMSLAE